VTSSAPTQDDVDKAITAFNFCISLIRDECLWSAGSFDKPHITTKNLKDVISHIAALEAKNKQMVEAIEMYLHNVDLMNKPGRPKAWNGDFVIQIMREAIAQTGDK